MVQSFWISHFPLPSLKSSLTGAESHMQAVFVWRVASFRVAMRCGSCQPSMSLGEMGERFERCTMQREGGANRHPDLACFYRAETAPRMASSKGM